MLKIRVTLDDFEDFTPLYAAFGFERNGHLKPSGRFIEGGKKTETLWVGLGETKEREWREKTG